MTLGELVHRIEARGARLMAQADGSLAVSPVGVLTDDERAALRAAKADVVRLLRARDQGTDWSRVSLWQLNKVLEIAVPWADVPLILAPGCRLARELRAQDPKPGRVWCVCEVLDLLLTNVPPADARKIAEAKLVFGGAVAGAWRQGRA